MRQAKKRGSGFTSWAEVDEALRRLGQLSRRLERAEAELAERVARLKEISQERLGPLETERAELERRVEEFTRARRAELTGRSLELTHGRVGFRTATRISLPDPEEALARLKRLGLAGCVRVKESVDLAALRRLPPATLAEVGAERHRQERFFYELARTALTSGLAAA